MDCQLHYTVVIASYLLSCLCFGQGLLPVGYKYGVSLSNSSKYNENDVSYASAREQKESVLSDDNKLPDISDVVLIHILNKFGLRSRKPHKVISKDNFDSDSEDYSHINNKFYVQSGDFIQHNKFSSGRPKKKLEQKRNYIGKGKKTTKKGNDYDAIQSKYDVKLKDDAVVQIGSDIFKNAHALNEKDDAKIKDIIKFLKKGRGKHKNTSFDKEDTDDYDNSISNTGKEKFKKIEPDDNDSTDDDVSKAKKGKENKNKEIDSLFHHIIDATKTIEDLVHEINVDANNKSCKKIVRNAKSIATLAKERCSY